MQKWETFEEVGNLAKSVSGDTKHRRRLFPADFLKLREYRTLICSLDELQ